jgi:hypothetical protein
LASILASVAAGRVLARPGTRFDPRRDRHAAPDEATMRRVLYDINGDDLDAAISGWITTTDTHRRSRWTANPCAAPSPAPAEPGSICCPC